MKWFFNLKFGDKFSVGGIVYQKENFFSAVRSLGTRDNWAGDAPLYRHYYPWSKVQPVAINPAWITATHDIVFEFPSGFSAPPLLGDRVRTHYFGDGCFPPHEDDNRSGPSA